MDAVFNAYALTVKHHSLLLERLQKRFDALEEANTELVKGNSAKDNRIDELVQENSKKDARIDDLEKRMNEMQRKIDGAEVDEKVKARASREQLTGEEKTKLDQSFWEAVKEDRTDDVKVLINRGANVDSVRMQGFPKGPPALLVASMNGRLKTVEVLIGHGANVNVKHRNQTAIDFAFEKGHTDVASMLMAAGAKRSRELS